MVDLQEVCGFLEEFAPSRLAEDWDNVGLLVGHAERPIQRVMTCLTITPSSADEAVEERVDVIVSHHPLPFRPVRRLTSETTPGRLLLQLIGAGVAIYSPHTAFDSTVAGINQQWAEALQLHSIQPLLAGEPDLPGTGTGRYGRLETPQTLAQLILRLRRMLGIEGLQAVGTTSQRVQQVGIACGAAGQLLEPAIRAGCDAFITGETNFHTCLEAEARGVALLLTGHFASERFAVESLARRLQQAFEELTVWPSRRETDPLSWHSGGVDS